MRTITHRQLRNESGDILRAVANGETILISNNGVTIARLSPATATEPGLPVSRPATAHGFSGVPIHERAGRVLDALTDLRGER